MTILARRQKLLDEARLAIKAVCLDQGQEINAVSVNLSSASEVSQIQTSIPIIRQPLTISFIQVDSAFRAQSHLPDYLFCCAGGTPTQTGFIKDLSPEQLETCMNNNYLTAAFSSQVMLKLWAEEHETEKAPAPSSRHIVFINSVAAFCTVPGMGAYSGMFA